MSAEACCGWITPKNRLLAGSHSNKFLTKAKPCAHPVNRFDNVPLYTVYATSLDKGATVQNAVVANDEDEAYQKARMLYPRDRYDVTVYLQSADDD